MKGKDTLIGFGLGTKKAIRHASVESSCSCVGTRSDLAMGLRNSRSL